MDPDLGEYERPPSFWTSRYAIGLIVIGALAVYVLLTEHLAHVMGALPFLLLLQWPTLLTLLMFPVLQLTHGRAALTEETAMRAQFGELFERCTQRRPRFFSRLGQGPGSA